MKLGEPFGRQSRTFQRPFDGSGPGFSRAALLVTIVCLVALLAFVLAPIMRSEKAGDRVFCSNSLKNIGLAFRFFSTDHDGEFPFNVAVTNGGSVSLRKDHTGAENDYVYRHFATVSNELSTTKVLVCPEDNAPRAGTSRLGSVWAPNF